MATSVFTRDKSVENFFSFECIQEYGGSDHKFLGRCWEDDLIDRDDASYWLIT